MLLLSYSDHSVLQLVVDEHAYLLFMIIASYIYINTSRILNIRTMNKYEIKSLKYMKDIQIFDTSMHK